MADERIGVIAVFDLSNFSGNVENYINQLSKAASATDSTAVSAGSAGAATGGALAVGMGVATAGAIALVEILGSVVSKLGEATTAAIDFSKESVAMAGRSQELAVTASLLGQRIGFSAQEIQGYIDDITELGIRSDVSGQVLAQFARYNLDLAKATDFARVAQDAAIISGKDSSETLERLLRGIITLEKRTIRYAGVNVNLSESFKTAATEIGKSSETLTEQEKIQAALNAVLEEGVRIQGLYEAALETPAKQFRTLQREVQQLQIELGTPFLGAWNNLVTAQRNVVATFSSLIAEGGALYPVIVNLAAVAEIFTEALLQMTVVGEGASETLLETFASRFTSLAKDFLVWGYNLIVGLANGIIQGVSTVLTAAINFVTNALTFWFQPGSPPRVAPNIDIWGKETLEVWLEGFTKADFSSLRDIQSRLKSVFSVLEDAGRIASKKASQVWVSISEDLIQAFSTGKLTADVLNRIKSATGRLGSQLADLVKSEFALGKAVDAVARAQERLNKAREKESEAEGNVQRLRAEYNQLLREGADPALLALKRKEVNAEEQRLLAARKETDQAEESLDASEKNLDALEEQVDLQQKLIDQLIELAKARVQAEKADEKAAKKTGAKAAAAPLEDLAIPAGDFEPVTGISEALTLAIENAKEAIRQKWQELVDSVRETIQREWETKIQPALDSLGLAFDTFVTNIAEKTQPIRDVIKTIIEIVGEFGDAFQRFRERLSEISEIEDLGQFLEGLIFAIFDFGADIYGIIDEYIIQPLQGLGQELVEYMGTIIPSLGDVVIAFSEWGNDIREQIATTLQTALESIQGFVSDAFISFEGFVTDTIASITTWATDMFTNLTTPIVDALAQIGIDISGLTDILSTGIENALTTASGLVSDFISLGEDFIQGLIDGIWNLVPNLYAAVKEIIRNALNIGSEESGSDSPSKEFAKLGATFSEGLAKGILDRADLAFNATANVVSGALSSAVVASDTPRQVYNVTNSVRVPMNVTVNSGMDEAQLRLMVRQVIQRELQ